MSSKIRDTHCIIFAGVPGTGKTTMIKKYIDAKLKTAHNHVLIVTPNERDFKDIEEIDLSTNNADVFKQMNNYTGVKKHIAYDDEFLDVIGHSHFFFRNGLLIFDDCRDYLEASLKNKTRRIFTDRRHRATDIIIAVHGLTEIPPKFFIFTTHIFLFKTVDGLNSRKGVFKNIEKFEKIQDMVNKQAETNRFAYHCIKL